MKNIIIKILRGVAIIFMSLTVLMTLLGGVGTTCIAWNADKYGKAFAMFVPHMPAYQNFVYLSVAAAMVGGIVTYALVRRERWAYVGALITLLACLIIAVVHVYTTSSLKQIPFTKAMPTVVRVYLSAITLLLFLLLRLPGIWKFADFTNPWRGSGSWTTPTGLSAIVCGIATLTTPWWAGASHMLDGYNLVYVLEWPLLLASWAMILGGAALLARRRLVRREVRTVAAKSLSA